MYLLFCIIWRMFYYNCAQIIANLSHFMAFFYVFQADWDRFLTCWSQVLFHTVLTGLYCYAIHARQGFFLCLSSGRNSSSRHFYRIILWSVPLNLFISTAKHYSGLLTPFHFYRKTWFRALKSFHLYRKTLSRDLYLSPFLPQKTFLLLPALSTTS